MSWFEWLIACQFTRVSASAHTILQAPHQLDCVHSLVLEHEHVSDIPQAGLGQLTLRFKPMNRAIALKIWRYYGR